MITRDMYEILDDTSRPGYVKFRIKATGNVGWAKIEKRSNDDEYGSIPMSRAKELGLIPGYEPEFIKKMIPHKDRFFSDREEDNHDDTKAGD